MIRKLSHATFYVNDQNLALEFYTQKLGFEVRNDATLEGGFRWLTVGPKGQPDMEIILYSAEAVGMVDKTAVGHLKVLLDRGLLGAGVFETSDCRATYQELLSKGVEFIQPPQERPYGVEAVFKDGCGNWFSLTQRQ